MKPNDTGGGDDQGGRTRENPTSLLIEEKSIRQVARELHHSRDTAKKAIESAEPATYTLKQPRPAPVLGPYMAQVDELLEENERLPQKQRRTCHQIYKEAEAEGYTGSESRVRGYIAEKRRAKKKRKVYIPEMTRSDWVITDSSGTIYVEARGGFDRVLASIPALAMMRHRYCA